MTAVEFVSDDKYILSASRDTTLCLWNIHGEAIPTLKGHTERVSSLAVSSNNIISGSHDHTVRLWNVNGLSVGILNGHTDYVSSVAISSDNRHILSGSADKTICLWSMDGKMEKIFGIANNTDAASNSHTGNVYSVAFSSDNTHIISGSGDNTVRLWDVESGETVRTFNEHTGWVKSVAMSSDNNYILSGSFDKTIRLWDVESGKTIRIFNGHTSSVESVAFSPDNTYMLSVSFLQTKCIWDISSDKCLHKVPKDQPLPNEYESLFFATTATWNNSEPRSTTEIDLSVLLHDSQTVGLGDAKNGKITRDGTAVAINGSSIHFFTLYKSKK